ncbi:MAG: hypothetical protein ABIJ08_06255 [Nanoarchaeota archaeon]
MAILQINELTLAVIIGMLATLVYLMRVVVKMDRKISKIMKHQNLSENDI